MSLSLNKQKKKNTKKTNHSLFAKVHAQIFEFGKPAGKGLDYLLPPTIFLQDTLCLSQPWQMQSWATGHRRAFHISSPGFLLLWFRPPAFPQPSSCQGCPGTTALGWNAAPCTKSPGIGFADGNIQPWEYSALLTHCLQLLALCLRTSSSLFIWVKHITCKNSLCFLDLVFFFSHSFLLSAFQTVGLRWSQSPPQGTALPCRPRAAG